MRIQDEDEQQSSCTIVELDDSYEKLNGQNEPTVSSQKIVELNDTEEIGEINRDNNDKRMNGDHMDINMNKMINTGREDQLNRNEANDNTQGPRNRTCLVPIASTSGFQGPTVIEVTVILYKIRTICSLINKTFPYTNKIKIIIRLKYEIHINLQQHFFDFCLNSITF